VTEAAPENPLAGTNWQATAVNGAPVLSGTSLSAAFGADGSLNGSAGCNSYSARYTVNGAQLAITPPSASTMACEEEVMAQESAYLGALASASAFSIEGNELYILDGANQAVVEFVRLDR